MYGYVLYLEEVYLFLDDGAAGDDGLEFTACVFCKVLRDEVDVLGYVLYLP